MRRKNMIACQDEDENITSKLQGEDNTDHGNCHII
jgi:hypothetical protein